MMNKIYEIKTLHDIWALPTRRAMLACLDEIRQSFEANRLLDEAMLAISGDEWPLSKVLVFKWTDDGNMSSRGIRHIEGAEEIELRINPTPATEET